MEREKRIQTIIQRLEAVKARPTQYLPRDLGPIGGFIIGFEMACSILGLPLDEDLVLSAFREYGFNPESHDPIIQMKEKGFGEQEIMQQRLEIAVEIWKKHLTREF